jgi:hypothetical protein
MRFQWLLAAVIVTPLSAQEGVREDDTLLAEGDMRALLQGRVVEFFDGSKSRYAEDGSYAYTYTDDGPAWTGQYRLLDDSLVCVDFDNGSSRCDRFVRSGERVILIIADGTRFPVRNLTVYQN